MDACKFSVEWMYFPVEGRMIAFSSSLLVCHLQIVYRAHFGRHMKIELNV